ncbi:hypothetical protein D3C80_1913910 [compost metagenome]
MSPRLGHLARDINLLGAEGGNADIHLRALDKLGQTLGNISADLRDGFPHHGDLADVGIEDRAIGMYPVTRLAGTTI